MNTPPALVLFGFQGSGKSTIASALAAALGSRVEALDDERKYAAAWGALPDTGNTRLFEAKGTARPTGLLEALEAGQEDAHHCHDHLEHEHVAPVPLCVTIVDATTFLEEWVASDALSDRGLGGEDDERNVSDVLAEQVEGADVVVVARADILEPAALARLVDFLAALNPVATIVPSRNSSLDFAAIVGREPGGLVGSSTAPGWFQLLQGDSTRGFVYRARRPFHPARFWDFMNEDGHGILRSKGFLWLATRPDFVAAWSQAGNSCQLDSNGSWWANTPEAEWPEDEASRSEILASWDETVGDKRQELAIVGAGLDEGAIRAGLDACLLDEAEFGATESDWALLDDPFPLWQTHARHEGPDHEHGRHNPDSDHGHGLDHEHGPDCGHDHAHDHTPEVHVHGPGCGHDHHDQGHHLAASHAREELSSADAARFESLDLQALGEAVLAEIDAEHYGYALAMQEILVRKIPRDEAPLLAMGRFQLAVLLRECGETHRALPFFRDAIRALEPLRGDEAWMLGEVVHTYGQALLEVDEPVRAEEVFRRGSQLAAAEDQKAWESQFALELGRLRLGFDEPAAALEEFERSQALRETLGDRAGLGLVAMHVGFAQERLGNGKAAREALERAIVLMPDDGDLGTERAVAEEALARLRAEELRSKLKVEL